jgi:hypothetical protein
MTKRRAHLVTSESGHRPEGVITSADREHAYMDISNVPYATARQAWWVVIEEQCNLGCWHETQAPSVLLFPWGES